MTVESLAQRIAAARDALAALDHRLAAADALATGELRDLVDVLGRLAADAAADAAADWLAPGGSYADRLQEITAALSEALTPAQVAEVAVDGAATVLGAFASVFAEVGEDGADAQIVHATGYASRKAERWQRLPLTATTPLATAIRTGEPVFIAGGAERFAILGDARVDARVRAVAIAPLGAEGRKLGGLAFLFDHPRPFAADDRAFLFTLARHCAQALTRARLYQAQRDARAEAEAAQRWLSFLADAGAVLSASLDYETTLQRVAQLAVPPLADWCTVSVADEDGAIVQMGHAHVTPAGADAIIELQQRFPLAPDSPHPVARVIATGEPALCSDVTPAILARIAGHPERAALLRKAGIVSYMVVPLVARGHTIGCINLVSADPARRYGEATLALAQEIARRAALAADNARLYQEAREAVVARDAALAAVEAERSRLFALFMQTPAVIAYLRGPQHIITFANPGAIRMLGGEDPTGRRVQDVLANLTAGTGYLAALNHAAHTGNPFVVNEAPAQVDRHGSGTPEPSFFNLTVQPTRDSAGVVDGILIHAVDVTDQVMARRQVEALAADNARLYDEASEALRVRDEFFSAVSHDLNTPLTTIKGLAQLLARRVAQTGSDDQRWLVDGLSSVDAAATRMRALISQLLDVARLQAGEPLSLDLQTLNLATLVRQVVDEHRKVTENIRILLETPEPEPVGAWDAVRIERVLTNLLSNAIKYSPGGREVTVTVRQEGEGAEAVAILAVRDSGIGIPASDLPHVFERFYRGSNVTGRIGGTGIGLAGARQIVEQHGGTIAVESVEGVGAAFSVRLPLEGTGSREQGTGTVG